MDISESIARPLGENWLDVGSEIESLGYKVGVQNN